MLHPGKYRAIAEVTIETCQSNGGFSDARVFNSATYQPGDEFEILRTANGIFARVMEDPFSDEDPFVNEEIGKVERIKKA